MGSGSKTKTTQTSDASSMLWKLPGYQQLIGQAVSGASNLPQYTYEGLTTAQNNAINAMADQNNSIFNGSTYLQTQGQNVAATGASATEQGLSTAQNALGQLNKIQGMSASDYNRLISQYTNSDLVKAQEAQSTKALNEELAGQINELNQSATQTGNMGSSRAGVAQGVMTGKTQEAIAKANLGIEQNAYQNALGMAQYQTTMAQGTAAQRAQYGLASAQQGNALTQTGLNAFTTGLSQYQNAVSNQYQAGSLLQSNAQNQANTARMNQMLQENPALFRAALLNQQLAPLATPYMNQSQTTTQKSGGNLGGLLGAVGTVGGVLAAPFTAGTSLAMTAAEGGAFGGAVMGGIGSYWGS